MKKSFLMKLTDVMDKLHRIQWSKFDRDTTTLKSKDDKWEVSYRIVEANSFTHNFFVMPLQIVFHVRYMGQVVQTWGCESNADNAEFLKFFKSRQAEANQLQDGIDRQVEKLGESEWNNL